MRDKFNILVLLKMAEFINVWIFWMPIILLPRRNFRNCLLNWRNLIIKYICIWICTMLINFLINWKLRKIMLWLSFLKKREFKVNLHWILNSLMLCLNVSEKYHLNLHNHQLWLYCPYSEVLTVNLSTFS